MVVGEEDFRKTVAVDVDGVLAYWQHGMRRKGVIGEPNPGAREFMIFLKECGHRIVVYTTRCKIMPSIESGIGAVVLQERIVQWLALHDIPYDEVYIGQGKPFADAYVDDRAVECRPQSDWDAWQKARLRVEELTK